MNATSTQASSMLDDIQDLTASEIHAVSGAGGYRRDDGSSFSWTGPNGQTYDDLVFVGTHYFEYADGGREYYSDIFARPSMPLNSIYLATAPSYIYADR